MRNLKPIALLLLLLAYNYGRSNSEFAKANNLYAKQKYSEAKQVFKKLIADGFTHAHIYYNLGNCYFKTDSIAWAILYYEKAKKFLPNDAEINFNIEVSKKYLTDKIEQPPKPVITQLLNSVAQSKSTDGWAANCIIMLITSFMLFAIFLLSEKSITKRISFWTSAISVIAAIVSYTMVARNYNLISSKNEAIILGSSVEIKSSPEENGKNLFIIHAGIKGEILNKAGDWFELKLSDNHVGWVQAKEIAEI